MRFWGLTLIFLNLLLFLDNQLHARVLEPIEISAHQENTLGSQNQNIKINQTSNLNSGIDKILANQSGFHILRQGGIEANFHIAIEGSDFDEIGLYLDGIPLTSARGQSFPLNLIPLSQLSQIKIKRGPSFGFNGQTTSGGSLYLESQKILPQSQLFASVRLSSFNTQKINVGASIGKPQFGISLHHALTSTKGNFKFLDDQGTPQNKNDDQTIQRKNNDFFVSTPHLKLFWDSSLDLSHQLSIHLIQAQKGIPGIQSNRAQNTRLNNRHLMTSYRFDWQNLAKDQAKLSQLVFLRLSKDDFKDPNAEIGLGGPQNTDDDTLVLGNRWNFLYPIGRNKLNFNFSYQFESFTPEDQIANIKGKTSQRHSLNIGTQADFIFFNRLKTSPQVWLENTFNKLSLASPSQVSPVSASKNQSSHRVSFTLANELKLSKNFLLIGEVGHSQRQPSFPELFGDRGGIVGNPNLKSQTFWRYRFGISYQDPLLLKKQKGRLQLGTYFFQKHIENYIQLEQLASFSRAENIGQAKMTGWEAMAILTVHSRYQINAHYNFLSAKNKSHPLNLYLSGKPKHKFHLSIEANYDWLVINSYYQWVDQNYLNRLNTLVTKKRSLLDVQVGFQIKKNLWLKTGIENLFDEKTVDFLGYPLPGRQFFVELNTRKTLKK